MRLHQCSHALSYYCSHAGSSPLDPKPQTLPHLVAACVASLPCRFMFQIAEAEGIQPAIETATHELTHALVRRLPACLPACS